MDSKVTLLTLGVTGR